MITSIINYNIIVYYGSDHKYNNGYKTDGEEIFSGSGVDGEYREGIKYLIYDNAIISPEKGFNIKAGTKLEIHFSYHIKYLTGFFDPEFDNSKITSVDLSHFDFSEVRQMKYLFYDSPVQVLDMSNIDMKNIEELYGEFDQANELKYINIRGIKNVPNGLFNLLSNLDLYVCQDNTIIKGQRIKNSCCFFYDNYIIRFA